MEVQYDEDLLANPFYKALMAKGKLLYQEAINNRWTVCQLLYFPICISFYEIVTSTILLSLGLIILSSQPLHVVIFLKSSFPLWGSNHEREALGLSVFRQKEYIFKSFFPNPSVKENSLREWFDK